MRMDRDHGTLVCDHCGTHEEPPVLVDGVELQNETSRMCPDCSTPLSSGRLEGCPLLCCPRCFGMLIGMDRFAAIIDAVRVRETTSVRSALPRRQDPGDRVIDCPSCGRHMLAHLYGGPGNVVIDTCERCQVNWLDPGELRRIAFAPDGLRLRRGDGD